MTTLSMETKLSGTSEESPEPQVAPQPVDVPGGAPSDLPPEMAAKLAEIRSQAPPTDTSSFLDKLAAEGIEATAKPPVERQEAPEVDPAPEGEETTSRRLEDEGDGLEDILSVASGRPKRDQRVETAEAIKQEAIDKGISEKVAHSLAHSTPRKDAREFLDSYGGGVQSGAAGQPASQPVEEPSAAPSPAATLAEVQEALVASDGEETASAVTRMFSSLLERLDRAETLASQGAGLAQAQSEAAIRAEVMTLAGDLKGRFPEIVLEDGRIDPRVGRNAALLWAEGDPSVKGDWSRALTAASVSVFGDGASVQGQQLQHPTQSPDLEAPAAQATAYGGPIDRAGEEDIFSEVMARWANNPAMRKQKLAEARKLIDRRNAAARVRR